MKIFLLALTVCLTINVQAANRFEPQRPANEAGGGAHPCKDDFVSVVGKITKYALVDYKDAISTEDRALIYSASLALSPRLNKGFSIEIVDKAIKNCPHTDNPTACGRPNLNVLQIYCPKDLKNEGWLSFTPEEKQYYALHELLWWTPYDDSNFSYSKPAIKRMNDHYNNLCYTSQEKMMGRLRNLPLFDAVKAPESEKVQYRSLLYSVLEESIRCANVCSQNDQVMCSRFEGTTRDILELLN